MDQPLYTPTVAPTDGWTDEDSGWPRMLLAARSVASKAELVQIFLTSGRRSSNKVSVGEPAEGSLTYSNIQFLHSFAIFCMEYPFDWEVVGSYLST